MLLIFLFIIIKNHDYESPETVDIALRETGVNLLKDDRAVVETHLGPVEILGTTYHYYVIITSVFIFHFSL